MSAHKFAWSTPVNTYTLAAVCEYCGCVSWHGNSFKEANDAAQKEAQKPCPLAPSAKQGLA